MSIYKVDYAVTGSLTVTVEADSPKAAKERADDVAGVNLCISCSGYTTSGYDPSDDEPPYELTLDDPTVVNSVKEV